ncbi:hypothetical protein BU15DRAFT_70983 [Melanogaster broomeanus]|nr:hypothetical protein BU15DRAFT_70983 [Melanogaster broomeanus]
MDSTTSNPRSNTAEEARTHVDDVSALHLPICALRKQRNTLSAISRFPPEILATIFVHCARLYCGDFRLQGPWKVPPWVNVSYICRQWRDVALNCSSLWKFLLVSSQSWTEELLYRSKMAPLTVFMDKRDLEWSSELWFWEKAAAYAERIQVLSLMLTDLTAEEILPKLTSRAPLLKTLRIAVERSDLDEDHVVLDTLFNGDTPALRTLELSNCHLSWSSSILCGLTSLRLRDLASPSQPTITELIAMLRRMPNLVYLYLESALTSASQFVLNSEDLDLPRLLRLSLIAPLSAIVAFLTHVRIPLKTEARIRCHYEDSNNDYTPLYPLLAKRTNNTPVIQSLVIKSSPDGLQFVFSTSERDCDRRPFSSDTLSYDVGYLWEDWDCGIPLKLDIDFWSSRDMDREDLIGGVCRNVSLTHLRSAHLFFDVSSSLSQTFWKGTLGHLQELRFIKLTGVTVQGLASMLSLGPHHRPENQDRATVDGSLQIFAPSLVELELVSVAFAQHCFGRTQSNSDKCTTSALCLYDALSRRKAEGYPLRELFVTECLYMDHDHVAKWEKVVEKVDWDWNMRSDDDYEYDDEYDPFKVDCFDDS